MGPGKEHVNSEQNYMGKCGVQGPIAQDPRVRFGRPAQKTLIRYLGKLSEKLGTSYVTDPEHSHRTGFGA